MSARGYNASDGYVTLVAACELSGVAYDQLRQWRDQGALRVHNVYPVGDSGKVRAVYHLADVFELASGLAKVSGDVAG